MAQYTVHPAKHLAKRKPFTLHAMPYVADTLFSLLHDDIARYGLSDVMIIEEDYPDILGGLDDERASKVGALCLPDLELTLLEANENIEFITLFKNDLLVVGTPELIGEKGTPLATQEIAQMPIAYYNDPTLNRMLSSDDLSGQSVGDAFAGILEQVEHYFKPFGTVIIRVGHMVGARMPAAEISSACHLRFHLRRWSQGTQTGVIGVVHRQNQVELLKIGSLHRAGTVGEVIPPLEGVDPHAAVGQFSCMAGIKPG